jgi:hypothetical protein
VVRKRVELLRNKQCSICVERVEEVLLLSVHQCSLVEGFAPGKSLPVRPAQHTRIKGKTIIWPG